MDTQNFVYINFILRVVYGYRSKTDNWLRRRPLAGGLYLIYA